MSPKQRTDKDICFFVVVSPIVLVSVLSTVTRISNNNTKKEKITDEKDYRASPTLSTGITIC